MAKTRLKNGKNLIQNVLFNLVYNKKVKFYNLNSIILYNIILFWRYWHIYWHILYWRYWHILYTFLLHMEEEYFLINVCWRQSSHFQEWVMNNWPSAKKNVSSFFCGGWNLWMYKIKSYGKYLGDTNLLNYWTQLCDKRVMHWVGKINLVLS